ncbi:MAG: hypothetical protein R3322_20695 [Kiloniellales bacterium]|jgi:hypothetical protein|nr:hypothetical protein [Kiloniellales bacterium]
MSKTAIIAIALAAGLVAGCESIKEAEQRDEALMAPVNCATAKGDLRVLENEKAYAADEQAKGTSMVTPASHIYGGGPAGGVTEDEPNTEALAADQMEAQIEIGRYQQAVDEKIAKIKATCGL